MTDYLALNDAYYPDSLKEITGPPEKLFFRGNFSPDIFTHCVAVVGSRDMTSYGEEMTRKFVYDLVRAGITIVSGFMYGIDYIAHRSALDFGGKTIAVLAGGIDNIQPYYHEELYLDIESDGGLIVSEFDGCLNPQKWSFPRRNRIVAGLSMATLVIEAGVKSGSLITATYTFDQSKKVFVLPGNLTAKNSAGIIKLIQRGAIAIYDTLELLDELNLGVSLESNASNTEEVIKMLQDIPMTFDEIYRKLNINIDALHEIMFELVAKNRVTFLHGVYYASET